MENTLNPTPAIPTFQRKPKNKTGCYLIHDHETATATTSPCKSTRQKILTRRKSTKDMKAIHYHHHHHHHHHQKEKVEEVYEKEELENKILTLQRLVPGGESLGVDRLFEETAGYILALQCQIKAMKFLATLIEGLGKENTKFGG